MLGLLLNFKHRKKNHFKYHLKMMFEKISFFSLLKQLVHTKVQHFLKVTPVAVALCSADLTFQGFNQALCQEQIWQFTPQVRTLYYTVNFE